MKKSFDEVFEDKTKYGTKIKATEYYENGKYIIVDQGQNEVAGYTDLEKGLFTEVPVIVFGDHTRIIKYINTPFFLGADGIKILRSKIKNANYKYLYYALKNAKIPNTGYNRHFKWLKKVEVEYPEIEKQSIIVDILDNICHIINARQQELKKLDDLVRARFVELFSGTYKEVVAEDVCTQIIDCPHSTPKYDEENLIYPAIRTSEIQDGAISWESMKYVGAVEYEKRIKRLKPEKGDIVYAREGTYGDCVILPERHKFCLGQRTMLFRPDYRICTSAYLHAALRSDAVKRQADESNAGSTVPHVNLADAKRFHFPLPPIELQRRFADFVTQVDKSKAAVQKALDETQLLFDSLMQEYFG